MTSNMISFILQLIVAAIGGFAIGIYATPDSLARAKTIERAQWDAQMRLCATGTDLDDRITGCYSVRRGWRLVNASTWECVLPSLGCPGEQ